MIVFAAPPNFYACLVAKIFRRMSVTVIIPELYLVWVSDCYWPIKQIFLSHDHTCYGFFFISACTAASDHMM